MSINWYCETYKNLTNSRKSRGLIKSKLEGYFEKHHIIPKCHGGSDDPNNLVLLTFREHVIAHMLLNKIYPTDKRLMKALTRMLTSTVTEDGKKVKREIKSSREAEYIRKLYSESLSGEGNYNYGKTGERASHYGKKLSNEAKAKISKANKGRLVGDKNPMYDVHLTGDKNPMFGKFGGSHPAAKKIIDPDGKIFDCLNDCAKYHKLDRHTISKWIKNKPEKGFRFYKKDC